VELKLHMPDQLDLDCDAIFTAFRKNTSTKERIGILEQCIDYLRMSDNNGGNENFPRAA
jgi:site-specific recombinase